MSEHESLMRIIEDHRQNRKSYDEQAMAILAAGFRKPRVVHRDWVVYAIARTFTLFRGGEAACGPALADAIMELLSPPEVETKSIPEIFDAALMQSVKIVDEGTLQMDTAHHRASHLSEAGVAGTGVGSYSLPSAEPSPIASNYKVAGGCDQPKCGWMNSTGFCAKAGCPRNKSKPSPEPTQAMEAERAPSLDNFEDALSDIIESAWSENDQWGAISLAEYIISHDLFQPAISQILLSRDAATIERCAKVARDHIKTISVINKSYVYASEELRHEIDAEQRGEKIASEMIESAIKALEPKP